MCGLAGMLGLAALGKQGVSFVLQGMGDAICHRGPDDGGVWYDVDAGIGLSHRRLSIVDLSPAGHQPMVSASGRFVIAFNGEIYNHLDLRTELGQIPTDGTTSHSTRPSEDDSQVTGYSPPLAKGGYIEWRGHSDTETLLAGIDAWGLEATLKKSIGMFAIALWDRQPPERPTREGHACGIAGPDAR